MPVDHALAAGERTALPAGRDAAVSRPPHDRLAATLLAAGLVLIAAVEVYWNSFAGVLVFDDITSCHRAEQNQPRPRELEQPGVNEVHHCHNCYDWQGPAD